MISRVRPLRSWPTVRAINKLALREFRTAFRMNGFLDYLPFIADCERGMGEPKKAIETAMER